MRPYFFYILFVPGLYTVQAQSVFKDISQIAKVAFAGENIGTACADFDRDGDMDVYISVRDGRNLLLQNQGNLTFREVGEIAGVDHAGSSRTSIFGDFNKDGWPDLYVGNYAEADILYLNNQDGTFTDYTTEAGIDNPDKTFSVNLADVDRDGWLDIYLANFQSQNKLYHNLGNGQFEDWTNFSRAFSTYNGMGALFFDYDNDGDQDLYLTHDGQPNILYQNIGNGRFFDASARAGVNYQGFGMGADVADINHDGWLDLYITNLYENVLFLNLGNGKFKNISDVSATDDYGMAWGTNFFDYDNDSWPDLYVTNDSYFSPFPNVLYHNNGDTTFSVSATNEAVASMQGGYGSATADFDLDGFLDLIVANAASKDNLQLFHNQMQQGNWVTFSLEGVDNNRDAIGARIEIWDNQGQYQMDELNAGSGYASQNSPVFHFGLGIATQIDSLQVRWPDGFRQKFYHLMASQRYFIQEGSDQPVNLATVTSLPPTPQPMDIWEVYPNPAIDQVQIKSTQPNSTIYLQVFDAFGRQWQQLLIRTPQSLDVSGYPDGIYFLRGEQDGKVVTNRLIILH